MRIISIDPGAHYYAWACFEDKTLRHCGFEDDVRRAPAFARAPIPCDLLVCEIPVVYAGRKVPNADLVDEALGAGQATMHFDCRPKFITPSSWKGQVDKKVHQQWIRNELTQDELYLIGKWPAYKLKDVMDAIGIGLRYTGRM
jgi:hypothetical protein